MKIVDKTADATTILVEKEELRAIKCSLGESMEVLEEWEYETRVGVAEPEVRKLVVEYNAVYRSKAARKQISVSGAELGAIKGGLEASLELEDWEFPIRMGFEKWEVRKILAEVNALLLER